MPSAADHDFRCRKQRIVETPKLLLPQVIDPVNDDLADVVADGKKPGRERLGEFCLHLPCVLVDPALVDVDVLELEGSNRPVAGAGQGGEADEGPVAALNLGIGRHGADDVLDLLQSRYSRVPTGFGDPRLLGRQVKILGIGVRNTGLVPWMCGQPEEEPLQGAERGVERGLAKGVLRSKALLFRKMRLKALRLLDMESLEVAESGVGFEAVQCLRDAVQPSLKPWASISQVKYARLIRSFWGLCVFTGLSLLAGVTIHVGDSALS